MKKSSRSALALIGTLVLLNNLRWLRVEALHGADVCGLVGSSICLPGFVGLTGILKL